MTIQEKIKDLKKRIKSTETELAANQQWLKYLKSQLEMQQEAYDEAMYSTANIK